MMEDVMGASADADRATSPDGPQPASQSSRSGIPSAGAIRYVKRYSRADLRREPGTLFVFGDNLAGAGFGGQAKECRGEPNAIGIPTKWLPTMEPNAFFSDASYYRVRDHIARRFQRLADHIAAGGDVVWPTDGIGTGLAELPTRAPRIHAYIERCLRYLAAQGTSGRMP